VKSRPIESRFSLLSSLLGLLADATAKNITGFNVRLDFHDRVLSMGFRSSRSGFDARLNLHDRAPLLGRKRMLGGVAGLDGRLDFHDCHSSIETRQSPVKSEKTLVFN
jgi:hypothetical protein